MTDRTFTAAELRELLDGEGSAADKVQALYDMLPEPPRPTLADMTDEERDECTGMQADAETGERVIIIDGTERPDGRVEVLSEEIYVYFPFATDITPLPDLPRMIAGMRTEYRAEEWQGHYPGWVPTSPWTAEKPVGSPDPNTRVVRRYVTEPEVTE